jgi:asparaginyl-tRNA synthetase
MNRVKINELLITEPVNQTVTVMGWVRTFRNTQFIALNDGSTLQNLQCVVPLSGIDDTTIKRITTGAALQLEGTLTASVGKGQAVELVVKEIIVLGDCDATAYPLQPKKHSLEFLREIAHLRFRTNTFAAVFKVRHALAFAIHQFFNDRGFVYMHTPIITGSDAEGAGEMFRVSTLSFDNTPRNDDGKVNFKEDFFGKETNLTVSGQLEAELAAMAFSEVYTFGPTFRAENSNTARHLAEFWMVEPEVAFADLNDNMNLAEALLKHTINYALKHCPHELEFLKNRLLEEEKQKPQDERSEMDLLQKLMFCTTNNFERLTYTQAIDILKNSNHNKKKKFKYLIESWGADLQSEHERYLVEKHFKKPVILTDYPKDIKAFYMRQNDDGKTVRAMDILFPALAK